MLFCAVFVLKMMDLIVLLTAGGDGMVREWNLIWDNPGAFYAVFLRVF